MLNARLERPLPLRLHIGAAGFAVLRKGRQRARLLRRCEQQVLGLWRLKEAAHRTAHERLIRDPIGDTQPRTPLPAREQQPAVVEPDAGANRQSIGGRPVILHVGGPQHRPRAVRECEGMREVELQRLVAESCLFRRVFIGDGEPKIFVQGQPLDFESCLQRIDADASR